MKLAAAFSILTDLRMAIALAVPATLWDIMKSPRLLLRPHAIPRIIMSRVWTLWGGPIDEGAREIKQSIISPNASGIVLDLGAGMCGVCDLHRQSNFSRVCLKASVTLQNT